MTTFSTTDLSLWREHPDQHLLDAIADHRAQHERWDAATTDAERGQILQEWNATGFLEEEIRISKARPETLEGMIAKCRLALRDWVRLDEKRWQLGWSQKAATLQQALEVLEQVQAKGGVR